MGAIGAGIQVDHSHPGIDQPGVLPGAYVLSIPAAAGEQPVITPSSSALQPVSQSFPRGLRDLERHGPTGLLLDDRRPLPNDAALSNIAQTEFYRSQPRSLASNAMLNIARSRVDPTDFRC